MLITNCFEKRQIKNGLVFVVGKVVLLKVQVKFTFVDIDVFVRSASFEEIVKLEISVIVVGFVRE